MVQPRARHASADDSLAAPRRIATREILIGIALVALTALLWINRSVLVLAFGALVFSTVIRSIADLVQRVTKLRGRWSVIVATLLLVAVIGGAVWMFGLRMADQFSQLQRQLPRGVQSVQAWLGQLPHGESAAQALQNALGGASLGKFAAVAKAAVGAVTSFILIAFASIYLALDPQLYRRGIIRLLPPAQRGHVSRAMGEAGTALTKWVRAQLVLMVFVGTLTGVGLTAVGVPLAFSLALIIGLFEFIPLLGPILGAIPGILLAFTQGPDTALYATLVYIGVQQIENNLLTPLVQRWAVQLPPAVSLFAVLACGLTFGLIGVIFATPIAVVAMVLTRQLYVEDTLEQP